MNKALLSALFVLFSCSGAHAGNDSLIVRQYMDSLYHSRARINMADYPETDARYHRLFAPFTFYHSPAGKELRIADGEQHSDTVEDDIDKILMSLYLRRPDLVENSENRLLADGMPETIEEPIKQNVTLSEKVEPVFEEPVIEPVEVFVSKPNFWTIKGDYYLQFLQNYISGNWYKGGESNYSMVGSVTMEANYNNKQKVKWDNKLELKLGFQSSRSDSLHSFKASEDLIRYTSKLGLQASNKWYYTLQLVANTQFTHGYKSNDPFIYSDFLSPLNVNISLGMDYSVEAFNKKLTGNLHIAPLAYNFRYVNREELATRYGLDEGRTVLHDFGSQFTAELLWAFSDNIKWKTRFNGYTTYRRVELEWENTFMFQFNKYISTNLFIYPRFDDGAVRDGSHGYWQLKEYLSLGFNYSF
ncbi:MAG: DUF3078 domain-containing protein [Prevotella sp.]|uniref:DUF3078 domain-containing protein n=1 Tax=Prevotella sp. TaxID=59823 RepID=UPI002A2F2068|nr:DUF3078 domain-containing protein [Prevotella sp.]MDD7317889.1 DUF3078 domain-containing protein [Prevotellaceae bacterium]MDY4019678.1 DUF3078 domain-containing protein [Prevotella sp.]